MRRWNVNLSYRYDQDYEITADSQQKAENEALRLFIDNEGPLEINADNITVRSEEKFISTYLITFTFKGRVRKLEYQSYVKPSQEDAEEIIKKWLMGESFKKVANVNVEFKLSHVKSENNS